MEVELAIAAVVEVVLQRAPDRDKCDLLPRDLVFVEQPGFQRFRPGTEIEIQKPGTKQHVHLVDVRNVEQCIQPQDLDLRVGFLERLAHGAFGGGFAVFHEARGHGPQAVAGFDGAAAQQDAAFPFGNASHHHFWIFVVNDPAVRANVAGKAVAGRHTVFDWCAASAAEFHSDGSVFQGWRTTII